MTTAELIGPRDAADELQPGGPPEGSDAAEHASASPFRARSAVSPYASHDEELGELVPLIGAVPVEGPPIILLAGPLVLFALALTGPFMLLLTLVVLLAACAAVVALAAAIVASPYLLIRRFGSHRLPRSHPSPAAAPFVRVHSGRGPA